MKAFRGFTLIEVLVALAIIALVLAGLMRAATLQVRDADALRERMLAGWVASNVLAQTRLATPFPATGRGDGRTQLGGRDWRWEREINSTQTAQIRRVDIRVFAGDAQQPSASLSGFAGTALMP
jgi:general secretion pathway protein I